MASEPQTDSEETTTLSRARQRSDSEFDRFERFAKKLVNVPKKEIDEQQKKWETRKDRPRKAKKAG